MYEYKASVISIVDGDTMHVAVDLGFDQYCNKTLRLAGINAPELSTEEGVAAKDFLQSLLWSRLAGAYLPITITTIKDHREKYGRYLATIFVGGLDGENINARMIEEGHAVVYDGR